MEIGWFPPLTAAFYALTLILFPLTSFFLRFTHPYHQTFPQDRASARVCFSLSYLQAVPVFLEVAQTRGLPGARSGMTRQLHLPCGDLRAKIRIFLTSP